MATHRHPAKNGSTAPRGWRTGGVGRIAVALVALQVLVGCAAASEAPASEVPATTTTTTAPSPSTTSSPSSSSSTTTAPDAGSRGLVDQLVVAAPDPAQPPYRRDAFGSGWSYDSATGCNTRERVLIAESLVPATTDDRCRPTGRWRSLYDGLETADPADLQIDHLVPLADAWRSGASGWTDDQRRRFANDLTDPNTLIAVSASTNESKGDGTPDEWLPPDRTAWCAYATAWTEVKARWRLSVTPAEKSALVQVLSGC